MWINAGHKGSRDYMRHETDHCETDERSRLTSVTLVVACQPTTAADPGQGALHDPSFRQHDEPVPVAAAHDLKLPTAGAGVVAPQFPDRSSGVDRAMNSRGER